MTADSPQSIVAAVDGRARRITTPFGEKGLVWRIWGSGAPLVLFHGGAGSWTHWIRNIDALAQRREVWALDLPCFGDSEATPDSPALPPIYDAVQASVAQAIPTGRKFDLMSFSFGSWSAAALAERMPERIDRAIFVGNGMRNIRPNVDLRSWRKLPTAAERQAAHRYNLSQLMIADPENIDELSIHLQESNAGRSRFNRQKMRIDRPLGEIVAGAKVRVNAIWGSRDAACEPEKEARAIKDVHPGARTEIVQGAGHWVQYEAAPAFNRIVQEMLA